MKELSKIYDTVLSSPGMNDQIKIDLRMSRKNILLLGRLIENGLGKEDKIKDEIFSQLPEETHAEFIHIREDVLKKAGLTEFYEKLKLL